MDKLLAFGRKAMFYVRVLSGYEERRIRAYRLQLNKRILEAQERKAALRKLPEQTILAEVRRMVEEMQNLNKKLEETESAIEDYFKPIDREAEIMMDMQLKGEERKMEELAEQVIQMAEQQQAFNEKAEQVKTAESSSGDANLHDKDKASSASNF